MRVHLCSARLVYQTILGIIGPPVTAKMTEKWCDTDNKALDRKEYYQERRLRELNLDLPLEVSNRYHWLEHPRYEGPHIDPFVRAPSLLFSVHGHSALRISVRVRFAVDDQRSLKTEIVGAPFSTCDLLGQARVGPVGAFSGRVLRAFPWPCGNPSNWSKASGGSGETLLTWDLRFVWPGLVAYPLHGGAPLLARSQPGPPPHRS